MNEQQWNGAENQMTTRRKLQNGDIVEAYGGTFVAKRTPRGGVLEKCTATDSWKTEYRTVDEYIASLYRTI